MRILFYDVATPLNYTDKTLKERALGGTEATLIRIAHALSHSHTIYVAQHCRTLKEDIESNGVHYVSFPTAHEINPDVVILLRQHSFLEHTAKKFPHSKLFFWMHNSPPSDFFYSHSTLEKYHYHIIAVSNFHRELIENRLKGKWYQRIFTSPKKNIPVSVIYNPIEDDLFPNQSVVKSNQLIFASSPQKGLKETLKLFSAVLKKFPEYELLIANPGHREMQIELPRQVKLLGALPHHQVIQKIRESFCVFYPQTQKIETFGLVYAEANAVGTPVLAHDLGAAKEVLSDPSQLVDGNNINSIIKKLSEWRKKRPVFAGKNEFRLKKVATKWLDVFNS